MALTFQDKRLAHTQAKIPEAAELDPHALAAFGGGRPVQLHQLSGSAL
jgi:hypothetical protein